MGDTFKYSGERKSFQSLNAPYFWTSLIKEWRHLLFWRRDPLAILITSRKMTADELDYLHYNPLQPHWKLCDDPINYRFSSARFYETDKDELKMLTDYMDNL